MFITIKKGLEKSGMRNYGCIKELKFDKNGKLLPQTVNYKIEHEEDVKEMVEKYINNKCNFKIKYDDKGDCEFKKKE